MNNAHEAILSALFTLLQDSVVVNFTGNGASTSPTVSTLSSTIGFFTGLPVFGPGVPRGAVISSFDPLAATVTLDQNLTANSTSGAFATGFLTASRRLELWTEVSAQPALFLRHTGDTDDYQNTVLQKTTLEAEIWIYSKSGQNPNGVPDTALNNLITAVRSALAPDRRGYPQTLGGLVQWARIEGRSEYDPGDLDDQAKALIPVKILCP